MKKRALCIAFVMELCVIVCVLNGGEIKGTITAKQTRIKKDVLVFIENIHSGKIFQTPSENPSMDQKNLTFRPHILPIVVGATVEFPNNDHVLHSVFSPSQTKKFNLGSYLPRMSKSVVFDKLGKVVVLCKIHPQMSAFIIVLKNPYFALTDEIGRYTISDVPAGTYRLSTWHVKLKTTTREVTVTSEGVVEVNFDLATGDPANLLELLK